MNLTLIVVVVVVVVVVLVLFFALALLKAKLGRGSAAAAADADYELRKSIFTPAERSFLGVLEGVLPDGVGILAKVRFGDVFKTRKGLTASRRATASNRIDRKHVDFLLVRTTDLAPVVGLELDDSSHDEERRKQRDAFVDEVFRSCGLPLIHIPAQAAYHPGDPRTKITAALAPRAA